MTDGAIERTCSETAVAGQPGHSDKKNVSPGSVLTTIGLALFAFSAAPLCGYPALLAIPPWTPGATPAAVCFWLAIGFSIVGLTLYALAQQRNPAWGLLGSIPLAGPVIGLVSLTWKSPSETHGGRAHLISELLRLSGYLMGGAITVHEISSRWDSVSGWVTTSSGEWSPSLESCCPSVGLEIPVFVLWGLSFALTGRIVSVLITRSWSVATPWLLARTGLLGLSLLAILTTTLASLAAQNVFDGRATDAVATLRVGLPRQAVEATIEEANRAILVPKHQDGRSLTNEVNYHLLSALQDARHETRNGQRVLVLPSTLSWQFRNALFTCLGKEGDRTILCGRHYTRGSDPDYGFSLRLTFTEQDTLAFARLETTKRQPRGMCRLVFEIPSSGRHEQVGPCRS